MNDIQLAISSLGYAFQQLTYLVKANPNKKYRVSVKEWRENRSLSQNNLYWKWLGEIAKQWEVSNDSEIIHEIFKKYYCPEKVINEHIKIKSTKKLDVGEMHFYLNKIEEFCINRGFNITIPEDSEYAQLLRSQNQ